MMGIRMISPGPLAPCSFAEAENHAALVFAQDADGLRQHKEGDDRQDDEDGGGRPVVEYQVDD